MNYLESHDGYTLGDFIRIATNHSNLNKVFANRDEVVTLEGVELNIARLAAFYLFIAQGITLIHAGQEYGRTKVTDHGNNQDTDVGKLDHNSYNKDNITNYMQFGDVKKESGLVRLLLRPDPASIK